MSIRVQCPECDVRFRVEDHLNGRRIRCQECRAFILVEDADADSEDERADKRRPARDGGIQAGPRAAGSPARRRVVDEDDEPRGRRGSEDDEEEDDSPRGRRRRPRPQEQGSGAMLVWILVPSLLVLILGVSAVLYYILRSSDPVPIAGGAGAGGVKIDFNPNLGGGGAVKKFDIVQAAAKNMMLGVKDGDIRDIITNGPANTRAVVHSWDNAGAKTKHMFSIYDVAKGGEIGRHELVDPQQMDLSPDGTRLAVFSQKVDNGQLVRDVGVWTVPEGKPVVQNWAPYPLDQDFSKRRDLAWVYLLSPSKLLSVSQQGQLDVWDVATQKSVATAPPGAAGLFLNTNGFGHTANHFCISPDRKMLAVFNKDGFNLYNAADLKLIGKTAPLSDQGTLLNFWGVSFSPDGKSLACHFYMNNKGGPQVGALAHWSIPDGKRYSVATIPIDHNSSGGVGFWGPNHVLIWDGNLYGAKVYSLAKGEFVRSAQRHALGKCIAQPQDGKLWFATAEFNLGPAHLNCVDFPQQELTRFPPQPNDPRRWLMAPGGITPGG